jgi:hypothetical protein
MRRDPGCVVLPSGEANAEAVPSAAQLRRDFHDVVESGVAGAHIDLDARIRRPLRAKRARDARSGASVVIARFSHRDYFTDSAVGQNNHREYLLALTATWLMATSWLFLIAAYARSLGAKAREGDGAGDDAPDWVDALLASVAPLRWLHGALPASASDALPSWLPLRARAVDLWTGFLAPIGAACRAEPRLFFSLVFPWINVQHFTWRELPIQWGVAASGLTFNELWCLNATFSFGEVRLFYAYLRDTIPSDVLQGSRLFPKFIAACRGSPFKRTVWGNLQVVLRLSPPVWPDVDARMYGELKAEARTVLKGGRGIATY